MAYIDNDNIDKCEHLNKSGLHLNMTGTNLLHYNYLCYYIDLFLTNSSNSFQYTQTISSGLSDHHKMVVTVLKNTFSKMKPKEIIYRSYTNFDKEIFKSDLRDNLENNSNSSDYLDFENIFLRTLELYAPLKKKILRANHAEYMTKHLRKAIMRRSALENKFHKYGTAEHNKAYKKQKNYCSRLYKKERRKYYNNLDHKKITDNKQFWKTVKPYISNKGQTGNKITLVDNNEIIITDEDVSEKFNSFFVNAVKSLNIVENTDLLTSTEGITDEIEIALKKYEFHPSILQIKKSINSLDISKFSFTPSNLSEIETELNSLNAKKSSTYKNIPTKILKENTEICSSTLLRIINNEIHESHFPDELKFADVTPIFKKGDSTNVKNYRPVSVLPVISKVFERIMQKQIATYFEKLGIAHRML